MKVCVIGDIHGRRKWKQVDPERYDKIIFLGDYVDSFDIPVLDILQNLKDIIEFKKKYNDKVVLLYGNHCNQYVKSYKECGCSGFKPVMYPEYNALFVENKHLFLPIFQIGNYLFSHAGVTKQWLKVFNDYYDIKPDGKIDIEALSNAYWHRTDNPLFDAGYIRGGGATFGGIFWADKREFNSDETLLPGVHQVVGHTRIDEITTISDKLIDASITFIDVLENEKTDEIFYEIIID